MPLIAGDLTDIETDHETSDQSSYATSSLTFTADRLYLIWVSAKNNGADFATVTGTGLTFTEVGSDNGGNATCTLLRSLPTSNTTTVLTIDFASQTQTFCSWTVIEIQNIDIGGVNGADAIAQFKTYGQTFGTTHSIVLDSAVTAGNAALSGFGSSSLRTYTPGTNEAQIGFDTSGDYAYSQYNLLQDSTLDVTINSATEFVGIGVEVNAGAALTPVILSIDDEIVTGSTGNNVVCTGAEAAKGTGGLTQNSIAVTETGWADELVTFTALDIESSTGKYGQHTFELTNNTGNSDSVVTSVVPGADSSFIVLSSPLATVGLRIDAIPDLIGNDQARIGTVVFQSDQTTPTVYTVAVQPDGSYVVSGGPFIDGDYAFPVNSWDSTDGVTPWGTEVWQTFTVEQSFVLPLIICHMPLKTDFSFLAGTP